MYTTANFFYVFSLIILATVFASGVGSLKALERKSDDRPMCNCGNQGRSLDVRVVGGHNALRGQFPYATALLPGRRYSNLKYSRYLPLTPYCGATLITDRHVVTAAHCVRGRTASDIAVDVSDYNIDGSPRSYERQLRAVSILKQHPKHRKLGFLNDVAVIELEKSVDLNSHVRTAWLPAPNIELSSGSTVTVYGWGRLAYRGSSPKVLQTVDLPVVENEKCQSAYKTKIQERMMICAGGTKGKDACVGDSGSGLVTRLNNEYVMVGVVSFGKECGLPHTPGVYTKLSSYTDWIYQKTMNAGCQPCIASPENFQ